MAVRNVVAPLLQAESASHLKSATRDVSFLRSDSWCRRYVSDLSKHNSDKCRLGAKGYGFVVVVDFQLTFCFFVVEVEDSQRCFYSTELYIPGLKVLT